MPESHANIDRPASFAVAALAASLASLPVTPGLLAAVGTRGRIDGPLDQGSTGLSLDMGDRSRHRILWQSAWNHWTWYRRNLHSAPTLTALFFTLH